MPCIPEAASSVQFMLAPVTKDRHSSNLCSEHCERGMAGQGWGKGLRAISPTVLMIMVW